MPSIASARRPISPFRLLSAVAGVGGTTYLLAEWLPVNASTAGFCYLIIVLAAATLGVFAEAAVTSVVAMLCFNYYFLPPVGRFTVADPQNWVALGTFLLTALVASHLSWRAQEQAAEARRRQEETEQLYALSRAILLAEPTQSIGAHGARQIAQIFGLSAVTIFDRESGVASPGGPEELPDIEGALRTASTQGVEVQRGDVSVWPISLGGNPIGAIAMKAAQLSDGATQALLNLLAISMERVRAAESARRVAAARDSEEFKSTLLDAIAHEFKTPLTSIKAAATALMAQETGSSAAQTELSSIIDEEADRLSQLVTEAVRMSRIDAGKWKLDRTGVTVNELVKSAIERFGGRGEERIHWSGLADEGACVFVDAEIAGMALRLLLDNALKYSPPGTAVELSIESDAEWARVVVADHGPGIADSEREKIFEKFYRSANSRQRVPGTGLGLHIAREIARAHGGALTLAPKGGEGAGFVLELPRMRDTE